MGQFWIIKIYIKQSETTYTYTIHTNINETSEALTPSSCLPSFPSRSSCSCCKRQQQLRHWGIQRLWVRGMDVRLRFTRQPWLQREIRGCSAGGTRWKGDEGLGFIYLYKMRASVFLGFLSGCFVHGPIVTIFLRSNVNVMG